MSLEDQAASNAMYLAINSTKLAIQASYMAMKVIAKLATLAYLKHQSNKELTGGERSIAAMLKSGAKVSCVTMNDADYEKLKEHAKKYNIQFHGINNTKGKDGMDFVTVFIRSSDAPQFNQLAKDYGIGAQNHGEITTDIKNPMSPEQLLDQMTSDPKTMEQYASPENNFDMKAFYDGWCREGGDPDGFLNILDALIERILKEGKNIDMTGMPIDDPEIDRLANDFFQQPSPDIESDRRAEKETKTTPEQSIESSQSQEVPEQQNEAGPSEETSVEEDATIIEEAISPGNKELDIVSSEDSIKVFEDALNNLEDRAAVPGGDRLNYTQLAKSIVNESKSQEGLEVTLEKAPIPGKEI